MLRFLIIGSLVFVAHSRQYCPTSASSQAADEFARTSHESNEFSRPSLGALAPEDVGSCLLPNGTLAPCAPGNQMCPPGPFGDTAPQFHVRDLSCGENDPNGPVFDPVHGVYHLHYQNHVGCRGGRTYGHVVSRDFTHWAHMPVSIWNDHSYDEHAIYTGSATVVDGKVVQVYPGLCYPQFSDYCPGGTNLAIAIPADPRDPLQTNWTKDVFTVNPIVNNTGRGEAAARRTFAPDATPPHVLRAPHLHHAPRTRHDACTCNAASCRTCSCACCSTCSYASSCACSCACLSVY